MKSFTVTVKGSEHVFLNVKLSATRRLGFPGVLKCSTTKIQHTCLGRASHKH
jgi:hypothetical protein